MTEAATVGTRDFGDLLAKTLVHSKVEMSARLMESVNRRQENADARVDMRERLATRNVLEERQMCALVMAFVFSQTSQSVSVKVVSLEPP